MSNDLGLGMTTVRAGELLTLLVSDPKTPDRPRKVSVIVLTEFDLSREMTEYHNRIDRTTRAIITEYALTGFLEELVAKDLVMVPREVSVKFGEMYRPASRLVNEYRYSLNPEQFWEDKLTARYKTASFSVFSHQGHTLTAMMGIDAPFQLAASFIDMQGEFLGVLRLDIISDDRHSVLNDDDLERLRLGLQADITMFVPDIIVMVESVILTNNPIYGINPYRKHVSNSTTPSTEPNPL